MVVVTATGIGWCFILAASEKITANKLVIKKHAYNARRKTNMENAFDDNDKRSAINGVVTSFAV